MADILTKAHTKNKHTNCTKQWVYGNGGYWNTISFIMWIAILRLRQYTFPAHLPRRVLRRLLWESQFLCLFVCFSCSMERSKRGECCTYGLSPWHTASDGLIHNLSKRWPFQTQLGMPDSAGDASWVHMDACKGILCTPYISSWMYLYFRIQSSSN